MGGNRYAARRRTSLLIALVCVTVGLVGVGVATSVTAGSAPLISELDGQLMVAHGDTFSRGVGSMATMQVFVRTAHGRVRVRVPAAKHSAFLALAGKKVRIRGASIGATFNAQSVAPLVANQASAMTPRVFRIAVVLMHLPATGDPKDDYMRFIADVNKNFKGPVLVAHDLMEF